MANRQTAREKITKHVHEHPKCSARDVADATGLKITRVCSILNAEVKAGTLVREGERTRYVYTCNRGSCAAEAAA